MGARMGAKFPYKLLYGPLADSARRRALGNGNERRRSFPLSGEEYKLCFGEMQPDIMAAIITALINFTREREGGRDSGAARG